MFLLCLLVGFGASCSREASEAPAAMPGAFSWPTGPHPTVTMRVAGMGDIELELYPEIAPRTAQNFLELARTGFYDGTTFHRVIPGFMIQGGDPNSRTPRPDDDGQGGPGYTIPDEFSRAPLERGVLAMANSGRPDSGGSQFFIVHREAREIDGIYAVFGRVTAGMDTVDAITRVEIDQYGRWGPRDRPLESVLVESIEVRMPGAIGAEGTASTPPGAGTSSKS